MLASSPDRGIFFTLSPGQSNDAKEGEKLLRDFDWKVRKGTYLLMDRAYEGDPMRLLAKSKGFIPVVPPKKNRILQWKYDKRLFKRRNEVERLFHRLKNFRRIATRYDKLDLMFSAFVCLGLTMLILKNVC